MGLLLAVSLMLPHSLLEGIGCETCVGLHSVVHFIYYCCTIDNITDGAGVGEGTLVFLSSPTIAGWHYGILCTL